VIRKYQDLYFIRKYYEKRYHTELFYLIKRNKIAMVDNKELEKRIGPSTEVETKGIEHMQNAPGTHITSLANEPNSDPLSQGAQAQNIEKQDKFLKGWILYLMTIALVTETKILERE